MQQSSFSAANGWLRNRVLQYKSKVPQTYSKGLPFIKKSYDLIPKGF